MYTVVAKFNRMKFPGKLATEVLFGMRAVIPVPENSFDKVKV